jgi:glutamate-1-semialdehyde 2,1-aminomutase
MMSCFDPTSEDQLYHGGSFNGNPLGCIAGAIAVRDLTAREIGRIDAIADRMRAAIQEAADAAELPLRTSGVGSAFGIYVLDGPGGRINWKRSVLLHLAAVNHGVYFGTGGEFGLNTTIDDDTASAAITGIVEAIGDVAAAGAAPPPVVSEPV